jgi:hypothetical protein
MAISPTKAKMAASKIALVIGVFMLFGLYDNKACCRCVIYRPGGLLCVELLGPCHQSQLVIW